jgi:putative endonuclease
MAEMEVENTTLKGRRWEEFAESHLVSRGFIPIRRNARLRHLEIDLIMRDGDYLVFVEVRFRGPGPVRSWDSLGHVKLQRIRRAVMAYVVRNRYDGPVRVDLFCIDQIEQADQTEQIGQIDQGKGRPEVNCSVAENSADERVVNIQGCRYEIRHIRSAIEW